MPRIDPSKLLETLKPLLDIHTGGIKSSRDADKILHLMHKFSKKLVSKCIYLNILLASNDETLDAFMENGGWSMIYEWLLESVKQGHYSVINDILLILLKTPATITRLKSSALPREVKSLAKSEAEGTRQLAEQVVAKWLQIARSGLKAETPEIVPRPVTTGGSSSLPSPAINGIPAVVNFTVNNSNGHDVSENLAMSDDVISATLAANGNFDVGQVNNIDYDDLQNIDLMDINPEMLELLAEHLNPLETENQLGAASTDSNMLQSNFVEQQPGMAMGTSDQSGNQTQMQPVHQQVNIQPSVATSVIQQPIMLQHSVPNTAVSVPTQVITSTVQQQQIQSTPKFIIRKVAVQPTVVSAGNADGTAKTIYFTTPSPQQQQYTIIKRDGKQYLIINNNTSVASENVATVQQQVVVPENISTPKKPAILTHRTPPTPKSSASSSEEVSPSKPLKTYSKKTNQENVSTDVVDIATTKSQSEKPSSSKSSSKGSSASSTSSKSSSTSKSSSSSRSSKSSAAAAREKEEKDRADKLREKTREAKRKLKERVKEMEREKKRSEEEKQKKKDDDTLKAVFGTAGPPVKIPKKPSSEKAKPSFEALIGIPGSSDEGIKVVKEVKSDKLSKSNSIDTDVKAPTDEKEGSPKSNEPPKERKHKAKVYVNHRSKHADLLETMTKGAKVSSKSSEKDKSEKSAKTLSPGLSFEDALLAGARSATSKPTKRPSIDNTKGGSDSKKVKIDNDASKKDKAKDEDKSKSKDKTSPKKQHLQESSLFMDQLVATADTRTTKRKRRTSSSDSKPEPEVVIAEQKEKPAEDLAKDAIVPEGTNAAGSAGMKPVFGFYQNRNEDDDDDAANPKGNEKDQPEPMEQDSVPTNTEASQTPASPVEPMEEDVFAPQEGEGQLKSCLRIVTPSNKPKKSIRWREEDELTEMFYFEHDETERVNVTKPNNNFAEQQKKEITDEKIAFNNKNRLLLDNEGEERFPWRPPRRIHLEKEDYPVHSEEEKVQEQREQTILQVFYLPGTTIPDSPAEPDLANSKPDEFHLLKQVSCDDVPVLTKVYDCSNKPWPKPKDVPLPVPRTLNIPTNIPPPPIVPPTLALALTAEILRSQALQQPPPVDANPFVQAAVGQAANPFNTPLPNANAFNMAFQFPNANVGPNPGFGGVANVQGCPNSYGDRDERRSFRDRDMRDNRNNRDRPYDNDRGFGRGDRGRGRGGDRGGNFRDRGGFGRESRFSDRGGGPAPRGGRRVVPCRFFARGHCKDGENCTFLHPGVNGPPVDGNSGNFRPRDRGGFPSRGGYNSDHGNGKRDNFSTRKEGSNAAYDPETPTSPDRDEVPPIQSPTPEFFDTPSSPTEAPSNDGSVRVIPSGPADDDTWG